MNRAPKTLSGKAGVLLALCLGAQAVIADEAPNVFLPPTGEPETPSVEPKVTTDPTIPELVTGGPDPEPQVLMVTGGPDPVPEEMVTTTGMPDEGEPPIAYSTGRGGDEPLPFERTMTMSSETPDVTMMNKSDDAVSALPPITADAVSAVATLERESTIGTVQDSASAVDATQVVGSAAESVNAGGPAIRNGRLITP